jgi:uncharacterized protein (DUF433 family)
MESTYYFKRQWDEPTGEDLTDNWGRSTYYFETDVQFNVLRQMQIFENGKTLKYDLEYVDDKFGGLAESPIEMDGFSEIAGDEFKQLWEKSVYKRFPEIVCTHDCLWGQPRLEGRRLAVGDIVSLVDVYHEEIGVTMKDYELSLQQIRQALHYCKLQECKNDNPEKFCHNCTLRIEQFNETIDEDDPEQPNWERAAKLFEKYFKMDL